MQRLRDMPLLLQRMVQDLMDPQRALPLVHRTRIIIYVSSLNAFHIYLLNNPFHNVLRAQNVVKWYWNNIVISSWKRHQIIYLVSEWLGFWHNNIIYS